MDMEKTSRVLPLKRGCTLTIVEEITSKRGDKCPKFLVLHSKLEKQLAKLSPFLVQKVLSNIIGQQFKVKMSSADLLVEVESKNRSDSLLFLNLISCYKVPVPQHRSLSAALLQRTTFSRNLSKRFSKA